MPLFAGSSQLHSKNYQVIRPNMENTTNTNNGAGASSPTVRAAGYFTLKFLQTGSTSTGASSARISGIIGGGGEAWINQGVYLNDLSTVTEEFIVEVGAGNSQATVANTNGLFFRYDRLTSENWIAVSESASTETTTDSGVAVVEDAQVDLGIYINADQTSVEYFIDDVLVATHTTNISTNSATQFFWTIVKSAGTTSRVLQALYMQGIIKR